MELAREAAIKAQEEKIEEKKHLVEDMRDIANELKVQREKLESDILENKKKVIEEVQEGR